MKLSIIIVNYNVKHFLEQCLYSVKKAIDGIAAEVIIIDNCSTDGSIQYLQPRFPAFRFIENTQNEGFARACNKGLQLSTGELVLFLNPDTIVPEDCFLKCFDFFAAHPDAGALGIHMIDGSGQFLRESKRSFPDPFTSLYKLFGLARLFPRSRTFSRYHLGALPEGQTHEVDVLAGAFMMIRRSVLDKTGGFDEVFFMYGEDVDLSYRIQKAGFKNYYYAGSTIIHFKGESTKRGSMNYVRMFYNAMSIFVRKHYGGSRAGIFNALIHVAIWVRAGLTAAANFIRKFGLPLIDALIILVSFWVMKSIWNEYVKTSTQYEQGLLWIALPAFTVVYLLTAYYAGLYDRWYKRSELVKSTAIATIVLLAAYALLPEYYRFSRAIVLFGAILAFVLISLLRWLLVSMKVLAGNQEREQRASTLVLASAVQYENVTTLMKDAGLQEKILGRVSIEPGEPGAINSWNNMPQLLQLPTFRELILCEGDISFKSIIEYLPLLKGRVRTKLHAAGSGSVVGSDSRYSVGEAVSGENGFRLADPYSRRLKRLADVCTATLFLLSFPIHLFTVNHPLSFFRNVILVLFGRRTWIGYIAPAPGLPPLRKGIIACNGVPTMQKQPLPAESLHMMNYWYARDYETATDLRLISRCYRQLGSHA